MSKTDFKRFAETWTEVQLSEHFNGFLLHRLVVIKSKSPLYETCNERTTYTSYLLYRIFS